jgi:hypothetical protein
MTVKKPSQEEEEYFARQNAEAARKRALEAARAMAQGEKDALQQQHYMHCPKCGHELHTIELREVSIDKCFQCNGTWLDAGELDKLAGKEPNFWQTVVSVFKE